MRVYLCCVLLLACRPRREATSDTANTQRSSTGDIVIGEVGSMTGSEATFGTATRDGIELAIRQANEAGGVRGRKLRVKAYDDQSRAEEATAAITKLITQDHVVAVIGEVSSSRSIAMAPIAMAHHVPMIAPSATNPKVTQMGDYIFRACFIDPFQGGVMAGFAHSHLKAKTAAIFRDNKSDYSMGLGDAFESAFKAKGGEIVSAQMYVGGEVHFRSQLTAIRAAKPDVLFVPGYYTEAGLIIRQARELGLMMPILGGDGWDSPSLIEVSGPYADNTFFSNSYSEELDTPEVRRFIATFKDAFGYAPDANASSGYEAARILVDALKRAPDDSTRSLRDALAATKDFAGIIGPLTIDEHRNAIKAAVVLRIADRRFRYVATVSP